jgi:hypothetical protein
MESIQERLRELENIVQKYPTKIPTRVAADFLSMNEEGLKAALMRGNVPFGFGYQKDDGGYRVLVIPTVTFYLWYTNTNARMVMAQS